MVVIARCVVSTMLVVLAFVRTARHCRVKRKIQSKIACRPTRRSLPKSHQERGMSSLMLVKKKGGGSDHTVEQQEQIR